METKDLRARFLKFNPFRSRDVEVELPDESGALVPTLVRIRQPHLGERNRILASVGDKTAAGLTRGQAEAVVLCCRNPDGDALLFSESDVPALMEVPAGSWVDKLSSEVMSLLQEGSDVAKKSEPTPT